MDSTTDNGRSSEDGEAGGKTEGGSDQIYFINASENCLTGTMPDEEEMPGLHNAVNLFMQEKSLEPQQISRHTSQDANVFEGRDEWWPIEENTKSLGQHQVLIDPPTQTEPPTALAADRLNKAEAEPSATETFECSAGNPATFLSDWDIDDRKRGNKAAQWAATTELQIAASKTQACKQAWQKDLLLRQFIREMQRKLQRMTNRAQERLVALTSHKNLPKDLSKELIRVVSECMLTVARTIQIITSSSFRSCHLGSFRSLHLVLTHSVKRRKGNGLAQACRVQLWELIASAWNLSPT